MQRRIGYVVVVLVIGGLLAVFADPNQRVKGRLLGQTFFGDLPSGYWRGELLAGPGRLAAAREKLEAGGSGAATVVAELLGNAGNGEAELKLTAIELLTKLGPDARVGENAVLKALTDADEHVRVLAIQAIPKIGLDPETAIPELIQQMTGEDQTVAIAATQAISEYRGRAQNARLSLEEVLEKETNSVELRWNAARTLGKIGPAAAASAPTLIKFLGSPEPTLREHCAEALGDIGPEAAELGVPALIPLLQDSNARVRRDTVRSFGQLGPKAAVAIEEIRKLAEDPEPIVKEAAEKTLTILTPGSNLTSVGERGADDEEEEGEDPSKEQRDED